jgi:N-acetylglutamate synthase-like GNAT family acetyltransferase
MTTPNLQVRRATVEDLPQLVPLWQREELPWQGLEKRFKEFQVVEEAGEIVGTLGLQIVGTEGRLHSEAFAHYEQGDALRQLLWERAQVLAKNFGLVRIWCQFTTPYWNQCGFEHADGSAQVKLPPAFVGDPHPWRFIQLKDESAAPISIEKEFAAFKEMERARTEKLYQRAKWLKGFATILVLGVFLLVIVWLFAWFRARGHVAR